LHSSYVFDLCFYNQHLYTAGGDGQVVKTDLQLNKLESIHLGNFKIRKLLPHPDGQHILTACGDGTVNVFDVQQNFNLIENIAAHNYAIYDIAFNPSGKIMATASRDKKIKIWNNDLTFITRIEEYPVGHKNSVNTLCWLSDTELITSGDDRNIMLWHLN